MISSIGFRPISSTSCVKISNSEVVDVKEILDSDKEYEAFANRYFGQSSTHNCFIIHPYVKWGPEKVRDTTPVNQLEEAIALIRTLAPWSIAGSSIVPLTSFYKKTFFGSGTLEKLKVEIRSNPNVTAAFINVSRLKNSQLKELQNEFGVNIFDRYNIVMQILRLHAVSNHARLQVSLAEIPYLRSRLRRDNTGIITGDHYETRKFMLQAREQKIKAAIRKLHEQRQLLRNRRTQLCFPVIAVVGYTNSGKTSLIKALTGEKELQPRNQLFATLDVTLHAGKLPSTLEVLYVDTVGFISSIPTNLIQCFVATLEDAMLADVIVHVEDVSHPDLIHQRNHVLETLNSLAVNTNSTLQLQNLITVGNKCDLVKDVTLENYIPVSATKLYGIDTLRHKIEEVVLKVTNRKIITIRVSSGQEEMRWLYKNSVVLRVTADNTNSEVQKMKVIITDVQLNQFKSYFLKHGVFKKMTFTVGYLLMQRNNALESTSSSSDEKENAILRNSDREKRKLRARIIDYKSVINRYSNEEFKSHFKFISKHGVWVRNTFFVEMDREVPSVPITTLAGVASLSELLPEMPLPTPVPQTLSNKSLLFHPRVAEEAQNLLGVRDDALVPQLVHSLVQTSASHIDVKDHYARLEHGVEQQDGMPELLKAVLCTNPDVFSDNSVAQPQQPQCNHTDQTPTQSSPSNCTLPSSYDHNTSDNNPTSPTSLRVPTLVPQPQRPSVITEQKPVASVVNCHNTNISQKDSNQNPLRLESENVQYNPENTTDILRQHRRPARGLSPAQASDAPAQTAIPVTYDNEMDATNTSVLPLPNKNEKDQSISISTSATGPNLESTENCLPKKEPQSVTILQPIVKLERLSVEFADPKMNSTKSTRSGKARDDKNTIVEEDTDSETEASPKKVRREKKNNINDDDEYAPDIFSTLAGSTRKRKNTFKDEKQEQVVLVKPKLRRVEKEFVPVLEKLSFEELMEKNTYQRFNKTVDLVVKSASDHDSPEIGEDGMVQDEFLLSRVIMQALSTETAKLKTLGATEMIPTEKLLRVLSIMELNIRGGDRVSPISDEDNETIRQIWMETTMERVMGAADACLVALYIMTSSNMPKRIYLEDVIDRVVLFIKYQLHNTIFPSFDCTYRLDNKKKDGRRKKSAQISEKSIVVLYNKITEMVNLLAELLSIQVLTDTSVLHASSMGVSPFFVENVSELQLACLKLVTTIFTRYENHRRLLLDDILASIARLPSTKRSLRTYRLNSEEHIQMLTALVLQLIQCIVALPENLGNEKNDENESTRKVDKDVLICNKYEKATSTAGTFLAVFLSKCGSKNEDIDYRPLFENFVQDLLSTVNKPEWPATELLLTLLGKMLVKNFSNKGTDMSLRVASLDYLGVVAARLRRDGILSQGKKSTIDQMVKDIKSEERKDNDEDSSTKKKRVEIESEEERIQFLQRVLLDFLAVDAQNNEALRHARHFYIAQWYKDATNQKSFLAGSDRGKRTNSKENHRKHKLHSESLEDSDDEEQLERLKEASTDQENAEKYRIIESRKKFLIGRIRPFKETISAGNRVQVFQTYIDYNSAELIAQYLASKRNFSQSFDQYLKAILIVLKETSIAIRTKALKCLTTIVEIDPSVLGRHDMQMGVNHSFLDHATSVREAAVDLVGKFVLSRPELISKYYEMLSARILDTGVSVRKRVIKILKDICIECPDFPKIPEICVKMIRRVNDEEGIRKLVMEVFQNMWFTPTKDTSLLRKVMNITDVVASSKDIGLEWFEQLLLSLFKPKEDKDDSTKVQTEPPKALLLACRQIVDCLIENVLRLEETHNDNSGASQRLVACLTTLYLFAKIRPHLLVKHASTLQPYLSLKCESHGDIQIISSVARMLELVVPLIEHPSETFLAQLEEDSMKLILQHDRPIVASCLSCLGSVVNNVTRNFKLIRDCFKKYYDYLCQVKIWLTTETEKDALANIKRRQYFRRALFIVGLLLRHFNFNEEEVVGELPRNIKDLVFELFSFFLQQDDQDIQANTLKAVGSICIRHYEFMLETDLKSFYHRMLTSDDAPLTMKSEVLINIEMYLLEEERRMIQQDLEWSKRSKEENLKEMGDISSGMASAVIQHYLKEILQSYLHPNIQVRQPALRVIQLILQQGLVHPVQIVPYLICMSTDCEKIVSHSADKQLLDLEKKYPGFIHTKSSLGIRLSYQLQKILQESAAIVRGFRIKVQGEYPTALNGYLYSILRSSRQQRRALVLNILKQFDEQVHTSLSYMLYLSDNLAYFPYMVQDEPLFIIHHIDIMISFSGTNLLQSFREGLILTDAQQQAIQTTPDDIAVNQVSALDEDDDDEEALVARVPEDTSHLQACLTAAQGCLLLLMLKQHLKDLYGVSDSKIQQYSPSEPAKVYEKAASRRSNAHFNPKGTVNKLKEGTPSEYLDEDGRKDLISQYLDFKQLMLKLDPDDPDDEENAKVLTALGTANNAINVNAVTATAASTVNSVNTASGGPILTEDDQVTLSTFKDNSTPKVPKLVISNRRIDTERRTPRTNRATEKTKKHRQKKKRRKFANSSGDESENDYSDPDFMA
ncbi:hypothetical protein RN001_015654 [Aquatica leii]|uniref:Nipped-B protein n=1 Tax=Aquatica leii TaxID=1421715 RepID=A0AAN7SMR1_9COLE|nr:hypothetical protein RN001_015654 [Aquatica leii]